MKINPPQNELPRRLSRRALTILEMLVSTAMLSFIVIGLSAMLIEVQNAFKLGGKQNSITDAGRTIMDMMASDLSQLSDPHFTNVYYPLYEGYTPPSLLWYSIPALSFAQGNLDNGVLTVLRTNQLEDIFGLIQTNNTWVGFGYTVSNWFTNSSGIGTLYRFVETTNAPLFTNNNLYALFSSQIASGQFTNTVFHRVADGVVHLKIYAYDADGNEMPYEGYYDQNGVNPFGGYPYLQYPLLETNKINSFPPTTNYLPHSLDIELGILEPEAFEHARALFSSGPAGAVAASNYLAGAVGQVEVFRQHILIPAAP